jgi:hypothetical protein
MYECADLTRNHEQKLPLEAVKASSVASNKGRYTLCQSIYIRLKICYLLQEAVRSPQPALSLSFRLPNSTFHLYSYL